MRGEFGRVLTREIIGAAFGYATLAAGIDRRPREVVDWAISVAPPPDPETVRRIAEFLGVEWHVLEEPARLSREAWSKGEK